MLMFINLNISSQLQPTMFCWIGSGKTNYSPTDESINLEEARTLVQFFCGDWGPQQKCVIPFPLIFFLSLKKDVNEKRNAAVIVLLSSLIT